MYTLIINGFRQGKPAKLDCIDVIDMDVFVSHFKIR